MAADEFFKGSRKNPDTSKKTRRAQMKEAREKFKRDEAQERQEAYNKLSILEKIALLDRRLGPNVGAMQQRAKLKAALEAQSTVVAKSESPSAPKAQAEQKAKHSKKKRS